MYNDPLEIIPHNIDWRLLLTILDTVEAPVYADVDEMQEVLFPTDDPADRRRNTPIKGL